MKKKFVVCLLSAALALSVGACGSSQTDTEAGTETSSADETGTETLDNTTGVSSLDIEVDPEVCVTSLADYSSIQVSLTGDYAVTDEDVESIISTILSNSGLNSREVTDRTTVQDGDYVYVDYTGYLEGEAFDGGSATGTMIEISDSNGYIPGFTDGLIGAEVGSTIECPVTFPEDYGVESLDGQEVIFEFTIHAIYESVTIDNITDEVVEDNFGEFYEVHTRQELIDYVKDYLRTQMISNYIENYMLDNSQVDVPEDYLEARLNEYQTAYAETYYGDEATMESYMALYGTSLDEVRESWKENLTSTIKLELIFQLIAIREGFEIDEADFQAYVQNFIDNVNYGFTDEQSVYESFGNGDTEKGNEYVEEMYLMNQALNFVIDNASIGEDE